MSNETTPSDTVAWRAVERRDEAFDGRFVFAVTSTRIYCRPSCPARRPRRERVRFFRDPRAAEGAGFRACRRCRPGEVPAATRRLEQARDYLEQHPDERVTLARLAEVVGGSAHHLQRAFKVRFGMSPREYVAARRLQRLRGSLASGDDVATAAYAAGYGSSRGMYEGARRGLGMPPATYRRGGRGVHIRYALAETSLGRVLLAATERGVCAVRFGGSDEEVERELRGDFPEATLERDDSALRDWMERVRAMAEQGTAPAPLPLDLQITAFQRRVFDELRRIPRGSTRSYSEVARSLGRPGAARAVGRACASNPVALLVPCHRVVAADGSLGGYRWGTARKQQLLDAERDERS